MQAQEEMGIIGLSPQLKFKGTMVRDLPATQVNPERNLPPHYPLNGLCIYRSGRSAPLPRRRRSRYTLRASTAHCPAGTRTSVMQCLCGDLWQAADINGDGVLDREEYAQFKQDMQAADREEYERIKRNAQRTGSPQLDEVSFTVLKARDDAILRRERGFSHEKGSGKAGRMEGMLEEGARKRAIAGLPYANQASILKDENARLQSKVSLSRCPCSPHVRMRPGNGSPFMTLSWQVISEMDARLNADGVIEALRKENESLHSNLVKETSMRKVLQETLNEAQADFEQELQLHKNLINEMVQARLEVPTVTLPWESLSLIPDRRRINS